MRLHSLLTRCAALSLVALSMWTARANAVTCPIEIGDCTVTITTQVGNPQNPPICQQGIPIVQVNISLSCEDCQGTYGPFYLCGSTQTAIIQSVCLGTGLLKVNLTTGADWEDALTNCGVINATLSF